MNASGTSRVNDVTVAIELKKVFVLISLHCKNDFINRGKCFSHKDVKFEMMRMLSTKADLANDTRKEKLSAIMAKL